MLSLVASKGNNVLPLTQFSVSALSLPVHARMMLPMIRADPDDDKIFIGTRQGKLYALQKSFTVTDSIPLDSPPSDILFQQGDHSIVSCMGITCDA